MVSLIHSCSADLIESVCPWFFEMKLLISERPNVVPIGLGNNLTPIELDVITVEKLESRGSSPDWDEQLLEGRGDDGNAEEIDAMQEKSAEGWSTAHKRKGSWDFEAGAEGSLFTIEDSPADEAEAEVKTKRTLARPKTSKPANPTSKHMRKISGFAGFAELAQEEEVTRQKQAEKGIAEAHAKKARFEMEKEKLAFKREKLKEKKEKRLDQRDARKAMMEGRDLIHHGNGADTFNLQAQPPPFQTGWSTNSIHQSSNSPALSLISDFDGGNPSVFPSTSTSGFTGSGFSE